MCLNSFSAQIGSGAVGDTTWAYLLLVRICHSTGSPQRITSRPILQSPQFDIRFTKLIGRV